MGRRVILSDDMHLLTVLMLQTPLESQQQLSVFQKGTERVISLVGGAQVELTSSLKCYLSALL